MPISDLVKPASDPSIEGMPPYPGLALTSHVMFRGLQVCWTLFFVVVVVVVAVAVAGGYLPRLVV